KLLDELVSACLEVKRRLLGEQKQYETPHPVFGYNPTTNIGKFISSLNSSTTTESVEVHCITDDELATIEPLKREIHELTGKTPAQIRKELSNRLTYREPLLRQLITWSEQLGDESLALLGQLYDDRNTKMAAAEVIRQTTLNGLPVNGIGGDAWKHMWKHVEGFISSQGKAFPPNDGEHCPTCLQTIDSTTAERMKLFHCYIQDKSQVEAQKAIQAFDSHKQMIGSINFDLSPHSGVLQEIQDRKPEIMTALGPLIGQFSNRQQAALAEAPSFTQPALDLSVPKWLDAQLINLKEKIAGVVDDDSLAKLLSDKHQKVLELEDKLKAKQQKQTILLEIARLKIIEKFSLALRSVVLTRVTNLSTTLSREGGIATLKAVFLQELKNLGYKGFDVETKTRGSDGGQKLKLVIPKLKLAATKIADVASEGEQKCIALAGFMAELTVDNRKSAIIFDDPVNSLDHKWRRLFADRIAIEARNRQVIVLTHDLPFLVMLTEATPQQPLCLRYIARRGDFSGYSIDKLPWDVMSTKVRTGLLRTKVIDLKRFCKNNPDCLEEDYNDQAKIIYGRLRDTIERLIEEWLLGGVVHRFGRNVNVGNIKNLPQWLPDDVNYVINAHAKCCRYFDGHDTATGLGVTVMPDIDELNKDVEEFAVFFGVVKGR
ncbi:MAG: ATP-binding protein, partial [Aliivibrio sp.]|uniref:AAA family ATPase n=1 Tax=Aliivibrio sp. TaxID=1872443 RepID=UPI001A49C9D0|nr:ATP-binding protein [Aliivibrio sp.]